MTLDYCITKGITFAILSKTNSNGNKVKFIPVHSRLIQKIMFLLIRK